MTTPVHAYACEIRSYWYLRRTHASLVSAHAAQGMDRMYLGMRIIAGHVEHMHKAALSNNNFVVTSTHTHTRFQNPSHLMYMYVTSLKFNIQYYVLQCCSPSQGYYRLDPGTGLSEMAN